MSTSKSRSRRILIALTGIIGTAAVVLPALGTVLSTRPSGELTTPTTTTAPVYTIKPLPVRPVVSAFVTTPEECPPPDDTPPDQPMRVCDITGTAVYELEPEALRIQLTNVDAFRNPLTGVEVVQMSMTDESARRFGDFTETQVGKQVAFVRDGTVVWGPRIDAPIDGTVLQLSGELTAAEAAEVSRELRGDE
jgi:hypothetical protein